MLKPTGGFRRSALLLLLGLAFAVKNWKVSLVVVAVLWFASC